MLLRDVLPQEFFREFMNTRAAKLLDIEVAQDFSLGNTATWQSWPGPEKNVMNWWRLVDGRCVGWNENDSRGWSFPVAGKKEVAVQPKVFKITSEQVAILKRCASAESVPHVPVTNMILEPGERCNTEDHTKPCSMNIAMVSDDPEWNDTDLADYGLWTDFRKGVELTPDGKAIVDFYIRKRKAGYDDDGDLCGNVQIIVEGGVMVRVEAQGRVMWSAT